MEYLTNALDMIATVWQAIQDVMHLCIAYAVIFAAINTLLWVNCREKVKANEEAVKKYEEEQTKKEKNGKEEAIPSEEGAAADSLTEEAEQEEGPPEIEGVCKYATMNIFGAMSSEGWARLKWGSATAVGTVILVLGIASALQLLGFTAPFITPWCAPVNAITGWCPFPPWPSYGLDGFSFGAVGVIVHGICLIAFAASVVDCINNGSNLNYTNLINGGLCVY